VAKMWVSNNKWILGECSRTAWVFLGLGQMGFSRKIRGSVILCPIGEAYRLILGE
jgi:hypothetical protein